MPIGNRVRQRRDQLGLTQYDLSALTRIPQTLISRIERGVNKNPGADVLKRLATALRCSTDWLLEMYDDAPDDISSLMPAYASG
jgi:transcriptional regulator with XRE-family HTH domain